MAIKNCGVRGMVLTFMMCVGLCVPSRGPLLNDQPVVLSQIFVDLTPLLGPWGPTTHLQLVAASHFTTHMLILGQQAASALHQVSPLNRLLLIGDLFFKHFLKISKHERTF